MATKDQKFLMLYSTTDGHTKTIMETIAAQVKEETKVHCDIADIQDGENYALSDYAKVMLGASIRYGFFSSALHDYVRRHQSELNVMPSAFFCVNLTARKAGKDSALTNAYSRKFLEQSPWTPHLTGVFAGALWYPRYNFFDRVMIQFIMKVTGGETDPTKQIVYTDWAAVRKFASDFIALPLTVKPMPRPVKAQEKSGLMSYATGPRLVFAAVGISAALVFGRRLIVAKRR